MPTVISLSANTYRVKLPDYGVAHIVTSDRKVYGADDGVLRGPTVTERVLAEVDKHNSPIRAAGVLWQLMATGSSSVSVEVQDSRDNTNVLEVTVEDQPYLVTVTAAS